MKTEREKTIEMMLEQWREKSSELFNEDGTERRTGAIHRILFWSGYYGGPCEEFPTAERENNHSGTIGHAYFQSGQKAKGDQS